MCIRFCYVMRACYPIARMQRNTIVKILKGVTYAGIYGGLLMPLMFVPIVIFPFVFSKLIFFQVLIGLALPSYLALAWMEPQYRPRWSFMYAAIIGYFAALLLSVIFAVDPVRAWWGNQERMNGLFTLSHLFVWLCMTVSVLKTWADWRRLLNYQIFLGVFMAMVALLQKPFPSLLLFPAGDRVGGLLDNPIYQGGYQLFILNFIALLFAKTKNKGWRAWYVVVALFSFGSMLAAGSRGPFMGLIFGAVLSAVAIGVMHGSKKVKIGILGGVAVTALVYVGIVTFGTKTQTFQSFIKVAPTAARIFMLDTGTAGRFIAWRIAWQGFLERPLTGWGLDDFHILFNRDYNPQSLRSGYYETWFDRAHNTVMDVLSMTGVVGFLAFATLWIAIYFTIIKARRKKWIDIPTTAIMIGLPAGYFLQNLFVFDHPAMYSMSYLLYALVVCMGFSSFAGEASADQKETKTKTMPWIVFSLMQVVLVVFVYLTSALPAYASYLTIKGNNYFMGGDLEQFLSYAQAAAAVQTPYLDEQTFLLSRNMMTLADSGQLTRWPRWKEMDALIKDVTARHLASHGMNAHPRFIYASYLQTMARATRDTQYAKDAEEQFKAAIAESPKRQQLFFAYARLLADEGRFDEAVTQLKLAASFDEAIGEAWWQIGVSYWFDQDKPQEGAPFIVKSQKALVPFALRSAQDAALVAQAYEIVGDKDSLKKLMEVLPTLPPAAPDVYNDIAQTMERQGLIDERNLIISAVINSDPTYKARLKPLLDGTVKTIEEALKLTEPKAVAPTSVAPTATVATSVQPTVAAPTAGSKGPRK